MAIRQVLVDDLDGGDAVETKTFAYDGVAYEIDLSADNIKKLDRALKPFIDAGRKSGRAPTRRTKIGPQSKHDLNAVRAWARGKGKTVSDRGRIPKDIIEAFNTEHEGSGSPAFSSTQ